MTKATDAVQFEDEDTKKLVADATAAAKAELIAQQKQVNALCRIAGRPELGVTYNEAGKSVTEVVAELDKLGPVKKGTRADAGNDEVNARQRIETGDEAAPVIDSTQIYADYNRPGTIRARTEAARNRMN